jgi:ribonuclease J
VVDEVPHGRLHLDGSFITSADHDSMRERRKMAATGYIGVALAIDERGQLASGPDVRQAGLPEDREYSTEDFLDGLAEAAEQAFDRMGKRERKDPDAVEEIVRRAVRREATKIWGKKPIVDVIVLEV